MASPDLLRFITAGSVDNGKSTLIGRLLLDSRALADDQLHEVEASSRRRGLGRLDLASFTDGLADEREQGITIDVAYRYFSTLKRRFILADCPGHAHYTRNMITGASSADVALILVDARFGLTDQTCRHMCISSLLGIPMLLMCVNKMDLAGWSEDVFRTLEQSFRKFASGFGKTDVHSIPVSALEGDNIVHMSGAMPWYSGPTVLQLLEGYHIGSKITGQSARMPIQYVITGQHGEVNFRGYAGKVAGGSFRPGDEVKILPSGRRCRLSAIQIGGHNLQQAVSGMSVLVTMEGDHNFVRGDMMVEPDQSPVVASSLEADICWLSSTPLRPGSRFVVRHTSREVFGEIMRIGYRLEITTLSHSVADELHLNDIGRLTIHLSDPLIADPYDTNRETGSFILIDEATGDTVGAGMIITVS